MSNLGAQAARAKRLTAGDAASCTCDRHETAFDGNPRGHNVSCPRWGSNLPHKMDREATVEVPAPSAEKRWRGMVLHMDGSGTSWARVNIPESVMRKYLVEIPGKGGVQPPNLRAIVSGMIESELSSDGFVEGRGWGKP